MSDTDKYKQVFDYLSAPELPSEVQPAVVFGRDDPLVAHKLGDLIINPGVGTTVISGGVGKDTGDLLERGYKSESDFLYQTLQADAEHRGFRIPEMFFDVKALNGGDNARLSLGILAANHVDTASLTAVTHATSSKRLAETLRFESEQRNGRASRVHRAPTDYQFDPTKPKDQNEAAAELLRLANWPAQGLLLPQVDIPEDLVDFVRDRHGEGPRPMSGWQKAVIGNLPPRLKQRAIQFAAKHGRK